MLAERPAEHIPRPPPLASGVRHDACLLKEGNEIRHLVQLRERRSTFR